MNNRHSKRHSKYHTRLSRLSRQSGMPSEDYTYYNGYNYGAGASGGGGDDMASNFDSMVASSFLGDDNEPLRSRC